MSSLGFHAEHARERRKPGKTSQPRTSADQSLLQYNSKLLL